MPALVKFAARITYDVVDGTLEPEVGRVALSGVTVMRHLVQLSDLEKRVAALEAATRSQKWGA